MRDEVEDKISNEERTALTTIRIFRMTEIRVIQLSGTVILININYILPSQTTVYYMQQRYMFRSL
jgi:hypothetical protein